MIRGGKRSGRATLTRPEVLSRLPQDSIHVMEPGLKRAMITLVAQKDRYELPETVSNPFLHPQHLTQVLERGRA